MGASASQETSEPFDYVEYERRRQEEKDKMAAMHIVIATASLMYPKFRKAIEVYGINVFSLESNLSLDEGQVRVFYIYNGSYESRTCLHVACVDSVVITYMEERGLDITNVGGTMYLLLETFTERIDYKRCFCELCYPKEGDEFEGYEKLQSCRSYKIHVSSGTSMIHRGGFGDPHIYINNPQPGVRHRLKREFEKCYKAVEIVSG